LVLGAHAPHDSPFLANYPEEGFLSLGRGTIWNPRKDLWNLHVWLLHGTQKTWLGYYQRW